MDPGVSSLRLGCWGGCVVSDWFAGNSLVGQNVCWGDGFGPIQVWVVGATWGFRDGRVFLLWKQFGHGSKEGRYFEFCLWWLLCCCWSSSVIPSWSAGNPLVRQYVFRGVDGPRFGNRAGGVGASLPRGGPWWDSEGGFWSRFEWGFFGLFGRFFPLFSFLARYSRGLSGVQRGESGDGDGSFVDSAPGPSEQFQEVVDFSVGPQLFLIEGSSQLVLNGSG